MFDVSSQESQAHQQFMLLDADQHKEIENHELFGSAAAYHAANAYTDHVEKHGVPKTQPEAQTIIMNYAQEFVDSHIDGKGLKLEKEHAMHFATQSLQQGLQSSDLDSWKISKPTKEFDDWSGNEKQDTYNNNGCGTINVHN